MAMTSPRGSLDETGVMHTGPTTEVMPVAAAPVAVPEPAPAPIPEPGPRRGWPLGWAIAAGAAAFAVALAFASAGDGIDQPLDTTTTVGAEAVATTVPVKGKKAEATPTTEAPTTTVPEIVSDPEETDQFPEGFPFQDTGPPGQEKKKDDDG